MSDWTEAEQILTRFREWLGAIQAEAEATSEAQSSKSPCGDAPVGLRELVGEFTALRHDVKLHTKSARSLEEQTAAAVETLREAASRLDRIEPKEAEAAQRAAAPLVEALADLDEAIQRGQAVMEAARRRILDQSSEQFATRLEDLYRGQVFWRRWLYRRWHKAVGDLAAQVAGNQRQILDSLVEGYAMVRGRLQRAMVREGLERIACIGRSVDPHTMMVVQAVDDSTCSPGTVVDEVRPGYLWNGKVLRFAEVRAVRGQTTTHDLPAEDSATDGQEHTTQRE